MRGPIWSFLGRLLDGCLLRDVERALPVVPSEKLAELRRLREAGFRHVEAAQLLTSPTMAPAALLILREAMRRFGKALLLQEGRDAKEPWPEQFVATAAPLTGCPPSFARTVADLEIPEAVPAWERRSPDHLQALRSQVLEVLQWLAGKLEVRSRADLRRARLHRGVVAIVLVVGVGALVADRLFTSRNLALHRPVTSSGVFPTSTAPADGSGLVNGIIEPTYGVHTNVGTVAWVKVDLGGLYRIRRVKVFNRSEARYQDDFLPLAIEASRDGVTYEEVGRCATHFSEVEPCVVFMHSRGARFIRIENTQPSYIALTELQVFGRR